jgi:hypothetical protein
MGGRDIFRMRGKFCCGISLFAIADSDLLGH